MYATSASASPSDLGVGSSEDRVHVGTSGWNYPWWRGPLYPPGLPRREWLSHYATVFSCVEINASFYRLPSEATFRSWAARVPPGFAFAVKGSRYVTHFKRLLDAEKSVLLLTDRARLLAEHLGPILWQLRPDMRLDLPRLDTFLAVLPPDLQHVLEPRHPSWFTDDVRARCAEAGVALASWDLLGQRQIEPPTAPFVYVRFHGASARYGGAYTARALRPWVTELRRWRDDGRTLWLFFNNDAEGHAVTDARRLRALLGEPHSQTGVHDAS